VKPLIQSEIGRLETVIVHTPGKEIESVSPARAEDALYNDILPMSSVQREHEQLVAFLKTVATVHEVRDLLHEAAGTDAGRNDFLRSVLAAEGGPDDSVMLADRLVERLQDLDGDRLVQHCIEGLATAPQTLKAFLDASHFALEPVPNLYFMRDVAMVIGSGMVPGAMAHSIRRRESALARIAFRHAPSLAGSTIVDYLGDADSHNTSLTLEGGDVLVMDSSTLLIGVSQRTTAEAIDRLASTLIRRNHVPLTVFAVLLPKERATIHLDMVFTLVDDNVALVHEPVILGPDAVPVVRAVYSPSGKREFTRWDNLVLALRADGRDLDLVVCGGADRLRQQREQWLSGANAFAFAPGKIIVYDCNTATLDALAGAGFSVRRIEDFIAGTERDTDYRRLVVAMRGADLARGGGGPRCMTLPVRRAVVE
jgi:arginine deiminase